MSGFAKDPRDEAKCLLDEGCEVFNETVYYYFVSLRQVVYLAILYLCNHRNLLNLRLKCFLFSVWFIRSLWLLHVIEKMQKLEIKKSNIWMRLKMKGNVIFFWGKSMTLLLKLAACHESTMMIWNPIWCILE